MNVLPKNLEIEKSLLGMVVGGGYFDQDVLLAVDDFFSERHRCIYRTLSEMAEAGEAIDVKTLVAALDRKGELTKAGGATYIAGLPDGLPIGASAPLREYERIIREAAVRRRFIRQAEAAMTTGASGDLDELKRSAEVLRGSLDGVESSREPDGSLEAIEAEYQAYCQRLDSLSIRVGITDLDQQTGGFQLGEVVTLIARTAVGKSAIAQNVIHNVLESYPDAGVVFFSLEMPRLQAFERQLQIYAGQTRGRVISAYREGKKAAVNADEFIQKFRGRLAIIDTPGLTLREIERRVRGLVALKKLQPVRVVVLDYLGYLGGGPKNAGIVERVSELARGVKELAKNLQVVVLLVAQTSRHAGDGSEEVTLTDARDSGAIEDSADFLIGCWRPELRTGIGGEDYCKVYGQLWFRILKARRGFQDQFCVRFQGETLRVTEQSAAGPDRSQAAPAKARIQ